MVLRDFSRSHFACAPSRSRCETRHFLMAVALTISRGAGVAERAGTPPRRPWRSFRPSGGVVATVTAIPPKTSRSGRQGGDRFVQSGLRSRWAGGPNCSSTISLEVGHERLTEEILDRAHAACRRAGAATRNPGTPKATVSPPALGPVRLTVFMCLWASGCSGDLLWKVLLSSGWETVMSSGGRRCYLPTGDRRVSLLSLITR